MVALIGQLDRGGSERQLYLLLTHLNPEQFERHVIVFNPSVHAVYDDAMQQKGIRVMHVPADCRGVRDRLQFVIHKLREIKADIVHSWTVHDNPYAGIGGRLAGVPLRWGSLRGSLYLPGFRGLSFPYRYLSLHTVSRIVVNSSALVQELVDHHYSARQIITLPNCVNLYSLTNESNLAEYGIKSEHRVIGIVGNLRPIKNHMMFIEGMARILPQYPDIRAIIVGQSFSEESDLSEQIFERTNTLGLANQMVLTGFRDDVPELMHCLDIFCLTSRSEGVPNVIMEAMAAGCPVIATRVGGIPDLVKDGENGLLVESEDVDGFAQAVNFLLNNPECAARLGRNGRTLVSRLYNCQTIADQLGQMYITAWKHEQNKR